MPWLVAAIVTVAFLPSLGNDFVLWDDDTNFLQNPAYRGLGLPQLRWMFTTFLLGHYVPVTWMTLGFDYVVWGMNPLGYHLTSLVLHVITTVVFFRIASRLLVKGGAGAAAPWGAGMAALLFGAHPLRVESVAWVTERRDVLSGLLYVTTVLVYLRACDHAERRERWWRWYALALVTFALALLSKAMVVTLPLVLVILDVYPLRRLPPRPWTWRSRAAGAILLEKVPFLALAGAATGATILAQGRYLHEFHGFGVVGRVAIALYALAFYPWKTLLPVGLSPLYALPLRLAVFSWPYVLSTIVFVGVTIAALRIGRRWAIVPCAWVAYVITLLPVSGIAHAGQQLAADRYSYLPSLPLSLLAGAAFAWLWQRWRRHAALGIVAAIVAATLAGLTAQQTRVWRDTESLWRAALAVAPSANAHAYLADAILGDAETAHPERLGEAEFHAVEAVRLNPSLGAARNVLGLVRIDQGRPAEAMEQFRNAIRIDPELPEPYNNLGILVGEQGRWAEAIQLYEEALRRDPTSAIALGNREIAVVELLRQHAAPGSAPRFTRAHPRARVN